MKYFKLLILALFLAACNANHTEIESKTEIIDGLSQSVFKVWGNCEMCKETIENSLKTPEINSAIWDVDNKMMTVVYDHSKISLNDIQLRIANVGYDNENHKGDDLAYKELPECCQYDRK